MNTITFDPEEVVYFAFRRYLYDGLREANQCVNEDILEAMATRWLNEYFEQPCERVESSPGIYTYLAFVNFYEDTMPKQKEYTYQIPGGDWHTTPDRDEMICDLAFAASHTTLSRARV